MINGLFVGRQQYIDQIVDLLEKNQEGPNVPSTGGNLRIISIWGKAGVGKTSLVNHILNTKNELMQKQLVLRVEKDKLPLSVASLITNDLIRSSNMPEEYFKNMISCRERLRHLDIGSVNKAVRGIKDKDEREQIRNELFKEITIVGVRYLGSKQLASLLRGSPLLDKYAAILSEGLQDRSPTRFDTIISGIGHPNRSFRLQMDFEKELSDSLIKDLRKLISEDKHQKESLVLIVDDYESLSLAIEGFLFRLLRGLKWVDFKTLVLIVGRDELSWTTDWAQFVNHRESSIGLNPFDDTDAIKFLEGMGLSDENVIADILQKSHRLPLLLEILANAYLSGHQSMWVEDYFDRITYQMTEKEKNWLKALSFLDVRVDKDTIEKMSLDGQPTDILEWFKSEASSRVSLKEGGWQVDPIVRIIVQERVRQDSLKEAAIYKENARRAREYYEELLAHSDSSMQADHASDQSQIIPVQLQRHKSKPLKKKKRKTREGKT